MSRKVPKYLEKRRRNAENNGDHRHPTVRHRSQSSSRIMKTTDDCDRKDSTNIDRPKEQFLQFLSGRRNKTSQQILFTPIRRRIDHDAEEPVSFDQTNEHTTHLSGTQVVSDLGNRNSTVLSRRFWHKQNIRQFIGRTTRFHNRSRSGANDVVVRSIVHLDSSLVVVAFATDRTEPYDNILVFIALSIDLAATNDISRSFDVFRITIILQ